MSFDLTEKTSTTSSYCVAHVGSTGVTEISLYRAVKVSIDRVMVVRWRTIRLKFNS